MTRGQLVFETARSLGLDDTPGSDELILMQRWVNRGIVDMLLKTHCFQDIGTMVLQSGVFDYRIDTNILRVSNITLPDTTGSPYALDIRAWADTLPYMNSAIATTTTPTVAAVEGSLMRVAPAPQSAITLTYIYVPKPTEIPADGTIASDALDPSTAAYGGIPTEFHDAILMYMEWQGALYDQQGGGFSRGFAYAPGGAYQTTYENRCKEIRKQHTHKAGRGLSPAQVGYPDRKGVSVRNDTYPMPSR